MKPAETMQRPKRVGLFDPPRLSPALSPEGATQPPF